MDKKSKLLSFAEQAISSREYEKEINYLLDALGLTKEEVMEGYLAWDLDPDSYGNEVYTSIKVRFAMYIHYLLKGSWHEVRQDEVLKILNNYENVSVVDVGFGAPQKYVKEALNNKKWRVTLAEFDNSALKFSETLLNYWNKDWENIVNLKKYDMDSREYIGDYDIYMFQDSIEHTKNPTEYLYELVKKSPRNSKFIFSLPVEKNAVATGSHHISWQTKEMIVEWLNKCGLKVNYSKPIRMNPEVDLFAEGSYFYECLYECEKDI